MIDIKKKFSEKRHRIKKGHGGPALDTSYPLGLALSGGGHRASLFGLGVLMAMRDAGRQPIQISSVSGGSITNAVLAYKYFSRTHRRENSDEDLWEQETQRLFETIVNKGAVTKTWVRLLLVFLILPPVVFFVMALLGILPSWPMTVLIVIVWATLLILRGLLIEGLISRRYFGGVFNAVHLESLGHPETKQVICCTDLVTGRPLYVSTHQRGQIFRRVEDRSVGVGPRTVTPEKVSSQIMNKGVLYRASNLSVKAAVRASAGFPGIPPRRLQLNNFVRTNKDKGKFKDLSSIAFLSDGGIWNNLATQPFEDGYLWGDYGPWVVVVADASAPQEYKTPHVFHIPGIAEFVALGRQAVIQNINTVGPRRVRYQDWIRRELSSPRSARFESERLYPVVSCMETPEDVKGRLESATFLDHWDSFLIDSEREWRLKRRRKTIKRAEHMGSAEFESDPSDRDNYIDTDASENYRRLCSLAMADGTVKGLNNHDPVISCPTTLGRIDRATAFAIVGRGYANTAITLYLTGLVDNLVFPKGWLSQGKQE